MSHLGVHIPSVIDKIKKANWLLVYIAYKVMNLHTDQNDKLTTEIFCFLIAFSFFIFCVCDFKQTKGSWLYLTLVFITGNNVYKEICGTACDLDVEEIAVDSLGLILSLLWYETPIFSKLKRKIG